MYRLLTLAPALLLALASCGADKDADELTGMSPDYAHPAFTLTVEDLTNLTAYEAEGFRTALKGREAEFLGMAAAMLEAEPYRFAVVDKLNSLPSDFIPDDLVELDDIGLLNKNREGHTIKRVALPSLIEMTRAAAEEGVALVCSSAYRSYVYQVKTYNYWVDRLGQEEADRVSAQPGKSQHQLGLAMDFGSIDETYAETPEGQWQLENAWEYGWSLSYPEGLEEETGYNYESWHYRFIGKEAARMEKEFFQGRQYKLLEFWKRVEPALRETYLTAETGNNEA